MTAVVIIEAVVILLLVILVAGLLKSHAEILRQLHALGARETETRVDIEVRNRTTGFEKAPSTVITAVSLATSPYAWASRIIVTIRTRVATPNADLSFIMSLPR